MSIYGSSLSKRRGLIFEYVLSRSRGCTPSIASSLAWSFPFGMPFWSNGSVTVGTHEFSDAQLPIPPLMIISLGSSSVVVPGSVPFRISTRVLLRKVACPPSPGINAREIPFWLVHKLGSTAIGTITLSLLLVNTPPATAFATYVLAVAASTVERRMASLSISEKPHFFHLVISPL